MAEYIDRQAAVEAIENTDWYHINQNGELVSGANSQEHEPLYKASEIYAALEEVPSADVRENARGEWIPCSERLPNPGKECLVWMRYTDDEHNNDLWFYSFGFSGGVTWHTVHELNASKIEVSAWMPLPEPYAERSEA